MSDQGEEKLIKPSAAKEADKANRPADEKPRFSKSNLKTVKTINSEEKNDKVPERPILKSVKTIDDKAKDKTVTIVDQKQPDKNGIKQNSTADKSTNGKLPTNSLKKDNKPIEKSIEKVKVEVKPKSKVEEKVKPSENSKAEEKGKTIDKPKTEEKIQVSSKPKVEENSQDKTKMATKPPIEKPTAKVNCNFYKFNSD